MTTIVSIYAFYAVILIGFDLAEKARLRDLNQTVKERVNACILT